MDTKRAGMAIYLDRLPIIKSYKTLIMYFWKVKWQTKTIKYLLQVPITAKLDKMASFLYWLLHIMSHDSLVTWPYEIRGSFTGRGSPFKQLSFHQLPVFLLFLFLFLWIDCKRFFKDILWFVTEKVWLRLDVFHWTNQKKFV